jgi:hypothetical protein
MLDLSASATAADTLHKRFLDTDFPQALSSAAFRAFKRDAYPEAAVAAGLVSWQHRALDEYRSLLAFSELLVQLMEVGLPFDLVGTCVRVVRDEARHVELCRRMVLALGGNGQIPGEPNWVRASPGESVPWAVIRTVLASLCVGETFSARLLAAAVDTTVDPVARAANQRFAADESVHSLFGWTALEMLLPALDATARAQAAALAQDAIAGCEAVIVGEAPPGTPHPFGYMPRERIEQTYAHCKGEILQRLERLGLTGPAHGVEYLAPALKLCRACNQHVAWTDELCPHCGASIAEGEAAHAEKTQRIAEVSARAEKVLQELGMLPK